jgi:long-subunit acyl-CoA synthetase (AMP-forming)
LQSRAKCILTTSDDYKKLCLDAQWVVENNIQVFIVNWTRGDDICVTTVGGAGIPTNDTMPEPNNADDIGLILFTSGTSGTKKVVPLTTHSIIAGIVFVMESWGLTSQDICLNMMPLYHV